jgi:hypothetical protein
MTSKKVADGGRSKGGKTSSRAPSVVSALTFLRMLMFLLKPMSSSNDKLA